MEFVSQTFDTDPERAFEAGGPLEGFESFEPSSMRAEFRDDVLESASRVGVPHGMIGEVGLLPDNRLAVITARHRGEVFLVESPATPLEPRRRETIFVTEV
jgi:hypothetical protein